VSNKENNRGLDDGRLAVLLKQGNEEAYGILVRRYEQKLFSIAYGMTLDREDALEIVQEVFLKVYRKIHAFRGDSALQTWLHRITVNQCLNWKRKWKRRFKWHHQPLDSDESDDDRLLGSEDDGPEVLYQKKEMEELFKKNLAELPEDTRVVFVLKEVEGLSYDEIAGILKIKRGTVSSRLYYARQKLKESMKKYLDGDHNP